MPHEEAPPITKVGTAWNVRLVVQQKHKEEIARKMEETGLKSTDKDSWLQKYQQAVSKVILSIGGEDTATELYGAVADAWNKLGPPEDVKRK